MQTRSKTGRDFPVRFETRAEGDKRFIAGYFARFDDKYELWENAFETIAPSAFDETLNRDILSLWNHDSNYPLGRTSNNTLTLRVDNVGLWGEVEINNADSFAVDAYERIKRGDVNQCSFGFYILDERMIKHDDGRTEFRIEKVELFEVSPVSFPAYKETSVSARSKEMEDIQARAMQLRKNNFIERMKKVVKNPETTETA